MANWLDKALGRKDDSLDQAVPYEIDCVCGTRTSGVRTSRAKRVICAQCGEPHFVLPVNVYPTSDRQYFVKQRGGSVASAAVETLDESSDVAQPPEPFPSDSKPHSSEALSQVPPPLPSEHPELSVSEPSPPPNVGDSDSDDVGDSDDEIVQFKTASEADPMLFDHQKPSASSEAELPLSEPEISFAAAPTSEVPTLDESSDPLALDEPVLQMPDGPLELVEMPLEPEAVADEPEEDDGLFTIPLRYESSDLTPPQLDDIENSDGDAPATRRAASSVNDSEDDANDDDWMNDIVSDPGDEDDEAASSEAPEAPSGSKPTSKPSPRTSPREVDLKPKRSVEPTDEVPRSRDGSVVPKAVPTKSNTPTGSGSSSQTSKPARRNNAKKKRSKTAGGVGFDELEDLLERESPPSKPVDRSPEATEFTSKQKMFLAIGAVVAVCCGLAFYSFRSSSLENLEITLNADLEAGEAALADGNFAEARRRFEAALSAMRTLGVTDQRAGRVRLMHLESEAMVRLFDDDPATIVEAARARLTNGKWSDWKKEFDSRYAGRWLILDQSAVVLASLIDNPPTGDEEFDAVEHPEALPKGRCIEYPAVVDGSRVFIAGAESALVAARVQNDTGGQSRLVFAGRMTGCRRVREGDREWVIELEPESVFLWNRFESLAQLGFGLEEDLELRDVIQSQRAAVDRTLELADRGTQR